MPLHDKNSLARGYGNMHTRLIRFLAKLLCRKPACHTPKQIPAPIQCVQVDTAIHTASHTLPPMATQCTSPSILGDGPPAALQRAQVDSMAGHGFTVLLTAIPLTSSNKETYVREMYAPRKTSQRRSGISTG